MQKKLKRIKKWQHAQKNYNKNRNRNLSDHHDHDNDKCTKKKLDWKIRSCFLTAIKEDAQTTSTQQQLFELPNWLEKLQEKSVSINDESSFNKQFKEVSYKKNTNCQQIHRNNNNIKSQTSIRNGHSRTNMPQKWLTATRQLATSWPPPSTGLFLVLSILLLAIQCDKIAMAAASEIYESTTPMQLNSDMNLTTTSKFETDTTTNNTTDKWSIRNSGIQSNSSKINNGDSIFMRFAKRFSTGNELWDGIIQDCYHHPSFTCFQNNVYTYLNGALEAGDVNVTQRLKFYKNSVNYMEAPREEEAEDEEEAVDEMHAMSSTEAAMEGHEDEHLLNNEIPHETGRAATSSKTPIEEVTTALYGKSVKFAMTHDIEIQLPEMFFDGATFRISPRGFEGNGIIAKLELIPKQEIQARLAGKILMNKIKKFLRSKLLLSFLALVLIIKIIKIKLFWLLPIIIGVGAAKKLLLKFLLFLFPALSHLFKLCSYYQQTYHSTKYHHHHHLIDHHHTIVPAWHSEAHHSVPEIIYTNPPKGHASAYLHGAPIHETYGPPKFEHDEGNWQSSGLGLGTDYISDINRAAQIEENSNLFKPNVNDANELHDWGLGQFPTSQQQTQTQTQLQQNIRQKPLMPQQQQQHLSPQTQQQRPPFLQKQQQQIQLQKNKQAQLQQPQYNKPHVTSQSFHPFNSNVDKQSIFSSKYKTPLQAQTVPRPVYTPPHGNHAPHMSPHPPAELAGATTTSALNNGINNFGSTAAQIAAKYEPARHNPTQPQQPLSPEIAAQLKEALRIQAEQRIVQQQQKILEQEPFVQDGQPLYPKNYDPFYSPILFKIDKIVEQLGVTDDLCKERLICSMYKDPARYSPHSNFVSAELSRDTNELQPATNTNPAVLRFYRLIQAARDGQDQRNCLQLYPQCNINTE